ncbi:hypothetical protein DY000_02012280 [Brassica cretica]|uniref:Glutathione peroxidase n=1 Tax=Brassica cretica TaxID=69181 RepID=A0ABQ7DAP5_BRACR|nr:hypothetical protein DY000_02012280 [Brassica cretica]
MATKEPVSVYDISIEDANGNSLELSQYKDKVLLIVNVASKWLAFYTSSDAKRLFILSCLYADDLSGMTSSNYTELNELYSKYKDKGLEILAFPCNQFGEEEPGTTDQITEFVCTKFKSEFPIFNKIEVNGENASPLYKFLKKGKWGIFGDEIQWNFAKFLVDKNGQAVERYYPTTSPLTLEHDIKKLLNV